MSSKTFVTISKEECLIIYKTIIKNSDSKWESGKKLAEINDYGGATSLAIISVEELIKGLIIFLDGKGFEFRSIKGINALFQRHQIRHLLAFALSAMGVFRTDLIKLAKKTQNDPQEITKLIKELNNPPPGFQRKLYRYAIMKFNELKREFNWFSKIDLYRQDGFYSDYEDQLKTPINISKSNYEMVALRLEIVKIIAKEFIKTIDNPDDPLFEHISKMKKDFKTKRYYEKIGNILTILRRSRDNPFETIMKKYPRLKSK